MFDWFKLSSILSQLKLKKIAKRERAFVLFSNEAIELNLKPDSPIDEKSQLEIF